MMRRLAVLSVLLTTIQLLIYPRDATAISLSFDANEAEQNLQGFYLEEMDKCSESKYEKRFDLTGANIVKMKSEFLKDEDIAAINLANNKIRDVPADAFKGVPNMLCLNLANNPLNLGGSIDFLQKRLVTLNLSGSVYNYESTFLSRGVYPNVRYLELSNNNIRQLPRSFATSFPSLTHLYLKMNAIRDLSDIYNILPSSVRILHVEQNQIRKIYGHPNLRALFLDGNPLYDAWSYSFECKNLQVLSLRNCQLENFPNSGNDLSNLVSLDLSLNRLWRSSFSLSKITSLKYLSLERNSFSSFDATSTVPDNLQYLSLSYNNIAKVNSSNFANLKNLRSLALRGNGIEEIDADFFFKLTNLEEIDLAENRLTVLPAGWTKSLKHLRYLNVNSNFFHFIQDLSIDAYLPLKHLFVKNNNITRIDTEALSTLPATVTVHIL